MAERPGVEIVVQPLSRAVLDGVTAAEGEAPPRGVDLAVLPCFEDERPLQGLAGLVDWRVGGRLSTLLRTGFFRGRAGEVVLMPGGRTLPMARLVLLGLGPSASFDRSTAEATGPRVVELVDKMAPRDVLVAMPGHLPERAMVELVFEGLTRALRSFPAEAQAQLAARAVGDEGGEGVSLDRSMSAVDDGEGGEAGATRAQAHGRDDGVVALEVAPEPANDPGAPAGLVASSSGPPSTGAESTTDAGAGAGSRRWVIVADPRHEARLRRLLEGPPRAAEPGG